MNKQLEEKILQVIRENPGIQAYGVRYRLEINLDTVNSHLKQMVKTGAIERIAYGKPWSYHCSIKENKE